MKRQFITLFVVLVVSLIPAVRLTAQGPDQGPPPGAQQAGPPQGEQPGEPQGDQGQNPPTGVGRISILNGSVSTQRGDSGTWVADTINTPVVPGDTVSTAAQSRTEIQLDFANVLRLDHDTQAKVADLSQGRIQVQVGSGLADYTILRDGGPNAEIDTPNLAVHPLGRGVYRIQVNSPTETVVTVRAGEVQVSTAQGSTNVNSGQTITVQGSDNPQYKIDSAQTGDEWDRWNEQHDRSILSAQSWKHTDPYYTGSSDLDAYGQWQNAPGYGDVWVPSQGAGWAPYSDGSWVWEPSWGWTWVSNEPWGWAPYHYGRWFWSNNAWAWWPGPVGWGGGWYNPIWAPAYVSFFGFGWGGWGFGFGFGFGGWGWGHVGWLPVGPCDRFHPWWGGRGVNAVNIRNVTNITNINNVHNGGMAPLAGARNLPGGSNLQGAFTNDHIRNAISTVAGNRFGQGAVGAVHGAVTSSMLHSSSLMTGRMPVAPTKASLSAGSHAPAAGTTRSSMPSHFAGTQTTAANRGSFGREAAGIRQQMQGLKPEAVQAQARGSAEQINRVGASSESRQVAANTQQGVNTASRSSNSANATSHSLGGRTTALPGQANQAGAQSWQRFAGQGSAHPAASSSGFTANRSPLNVPSRTAAQPGGNGAQSGWQRFSSQPAPRSSFATGRSEPGFGSRSTPGSYPGGARSYGYSSRPPLQTNRPMFSPRSAPSYGGGYGGYRGGSPGGYGGYSAPRPSGSYSGSRPSGSSGGGGGHSSGGGGGHSGGGGHGGGGHR
ncbi:MAG TPA: DUF6600 domain-containing protein [Terriglobia bacterium]